jgi:hypothetical protein
MSGPIYIPIYQRCIEHLVLVIIGSHLRKERKDGTGKKGNDGKGGGKERWKEKLERKDGKEG